MKSPLISVVVPIYKVEEYLLDCINSIVGQTYKHLEIILVDDGSPDRCPEICDQLASEDPRIKVIHKINGGLSDARNTGIKAAQGEYVIFIDSDDFWIHTNFLSNLINCVNKYPESDLVFWGRTIYRGNNVTPRNCIESSRVNGVPFYEGMKYLLQSNELLVSACMKLIRTSILKENNIFFQKGRLSEDLDWSLTLYQHIDNITAINENSYGYRKRPGSITTTLSPKHADDIIWFINKWTKKPLDERLQDLNLSFIAYTYSGLLATFNRLPNSKRKDIKETLRSYSWLLKHTISPKVKKVSMLYRMFGFNLTCVLLQLYYKLRRE